MGVLIGLLLGVGACLVGWALTSPPPERTCSPRRSAQVADLLVQAGIRGVSPAAFAGACVAAAVTAFMLTLAVSRSPSIAACFALICGRAPLTMVKARARRRRASLRNQWPEVVDHLASGVRAGLSLAEALAQLGERGPAGLREPFREFGEDYRASGSFAECLDTLKERLADPVADRIVEALRITREVGGTDLGRLLRTLSAFLRDDVRIRGELEARQSWTVNAARLAVAAPWVVLALLSTRPEAAVFSSAGGAAVLATGGGATFLAYRLMIRIGRLPEEARVLR
jgi:tight adherence protein B